MRKNLTLLNKVLSLKLFSWIQFIFLSLKIDRHFLGLLQNSIDENIFRLTTIFCETNIIYLTKH